MLRFGGKGYLENKAWSIYAIFISIIQSEKKHGEGTAGMEREKAFFLGSHVCGCFRYALGSTIKDVRKILQIFDPPPPFVLSKLY